MPKLPVYVFVTNGAKIKDGELSGTSNEAEFRYASFCFFPKAFAKGPICSLVQGVYDKFRPAHDTINSCAGAVFERWRLRIY